MKKTIIAIALSTAASSALAGAANMSITNVRGTGGSVTFSSGVSTYSESAIGSRHLDSSTGGDISVRNEQYLRGTNDVSTYNETTRGGFVTQGQIVDATRVGESTFRTQSVSHTRGSATDVNTSFEAGTFQAYDQVNNSNSYESGTYLATSADLSNTYYGSRSRANTYSTSAYGIYGAN